jgi:electron transport complex protein RnfC
VKKTLFRTIGKAGKLAQTPIKEPDAPERLIVPLRQHFGPACAPAVQKGDTVAKGQVIGTAANVFAAPVFAPVAAIVSDILDKHPTAFGGYAPAIVLEPVAGGDEPQAQGIKDFLLQDREELWRIIAERGVVETGPGARPLRSLLDPVMQLKKYDSLLIIGYDAEPMVCTNRRVASQFAKEIGWGAALLRHLLGNPHTTLLVHQDDYRGILRTLKDMKSIDVIDTAPLLYPDNLPLFMVKHHFGKEIPVGSTAADMGVAMVRAETVLAALEAVRDAKPMTHKVITVTGPGAYWPRMLRAPLGMTLGDVSEACGGLRVGVEYLVVGGPMTGWANFDRSVPITRETDAVLALHGAPADIPDESPCINCGDCVDACPVKLQPNLLTRYCEFKLYESAQSAQSLDACVECGMCGYVCPARRPMLQYIRIAKLELLRMAELEAQLAEAADRDPDVQTPEAEPAAFKPEAEHVADATVAQAEDKPAEEAPAQDAPAEEKPAEAQGDKPASPEDSEKSS